MTKAKAEQLELEIPEQGIAKQSVTSEQAVEWLGEERRLWSVIGIAEEFHALNTRHQARLRAEYDRYIQSVVSNLQKGESRNWKQLIKDARDGRILILQGAVGQKIQELIGRKQPDRAVILAASFSEAVYPGQDRSVFPILRAAIVDHPWSTGARDLHAVSVLRRETGNTAQAIARDAVRLDDKLATTTKRLSDLEELYHEKLAMEGPSRYWKGVAEGAATGKKVAFTAFCILLALPTLLAWWNWSGVTRLIDHLIVQSNGGISLAAIAVITIPTLAYGWLLKHVSRSYVQNLAIETDARHRRVMTTTFLGLAKRKAIDLTEADRALILNALFRPAPPHTADDGPPSGLIDLIRK